MNFEQWLQAHGYDAASLTAEKKAELEAKFKDQPKENKDEPTTLGKIKAEMIRKDTIDAMAANLAARYDLCTASVEKLEATAKECKDNDSLTAAEAETKMKDLVLAELRDSRKAPAAHVKSGVDKADPAVLAASMLLNLGVSGDKLAKDRDFGERVVDAAWKCRGLTLHGLIAAALASDGVSAPHNGAELFRVAVDHSARAGFSTVDLSGILGTVGNKLLLNAFTTIEATYPIIAKQSDFSNFLTYTMYRLDQTGAFSKVGQGGEIKSGALSETSYTNKLETSGLMLTLTRQQIINDDMNALNDLYGTLGKSAAVAVEEALYGVVMEASDVFYTASKGNYITSNPLSLDGLAAAEAAMLKMLDANSKPIYARPKFLLVPPELKALADVIFTSSTVNETTTANKSKPVDNPFRGRFQVVSSPFLSLSSMSGYSATTWYMVADPNLLPAFQVAYLSGKRAPTIETADASFNTLGIQMRCYFDFGVAQVDYRGAVSCDA